MDDRRDLRLDRTLDRYWDERFQGEPAGSNLDLEEIAPDLAATVRRVHALSVGGAPPVDPAFASRLWEDLMQTYVLPGDPGPRSIPDLAPDGETIVPHHRRLAWPTPVLPPRRLRLAGFLTAALVLLTFGLVYLVFGPGRGDQGQPAIIPAIGDPTATTAPATVTEETVVEITLPAGSFPAGELGAGYGYYAAPVGFKETLVSASDGCCPEPRFIYIVHGAYTVTSQGTVQVLRAGGDGGWETIAPGAEYTLGPGDASLTTTETGSEAANMGTIPVDLLASIVTDGSYGEGANPGYPGALGWVEHDGRGSPWTAPAGPVMLTLQRVALPPGSSFPPPPTGAFRSWVQSLENAAGTPMPQAFVGTGTDGTIMNTSGRATAHLLVLTLAPSESSATPTG